MYNKSSIYSCRVDYYCTYIDEAKEVARVQTQVFMTQSSCSEQLCYIATQFCVEYWISDAFFQMAISYTLAVFYFFALTGVDFSELVRTLYELHPNIFSRSLHCKIGWNKTAHCITCRVLPPSSRFTAACLPAKVRTAPLLAKCNLRLSSWYDTICRINYTNPNGPRIVSQVCMFYSLWSAFKYIINLDAYNDLLVRSLLIPLLRWRNRGHNYQQDWY